MAKAPPAVVAADFDGDGIVDASDACPEIAAAGGCPARSPRLADADADGVPDFADVCPSVSRGAVDVDADGCPDPPFVAPPTPPPSPPPARLDADGDGFLADQDCDDGNPAIHPGACEISGNRVDENCDREVEPFPTLSSTVVTSWIFSRSRVTLVLMELTRLPRGWRAEIRCKGRHCPFKRRTLRGKSKRGVADVSRSLKKRHKRLRAKVTFEVWIRAPNYNTVIKRYRITKTQIRKRRIPKPIERCVRPGESRVRVKCD